MVDPYEAFVVREIDDEFRRQWEDLESRAQELHISATSTWFEAARQAFPQGSPAIIAVRGRDDKRLVGILPLIRSTLYGSVVYRSPAEEFIFDAPYLAAPSDDRLLALMFRKARELGTSYMLNLSMPKESLARIAPVGSKWFESDREYLLDRSMWSTFGKYGASPADRLFRKAQKAGHMVESIICNGGDQEALASCFDIDTRSAKHFKGKGVFFRSGVREFYRGLAARSPSLIQINLLSFDGISVAYKISFAVGDTVVASQKAYLPGYDRFKPGALNLISMMRSDFPVAVTLLSLGKGTDQFKREFTSAYRPLYSIVISRSFLRSTYLRAMLSARDRMYRALVSHPKSYALFRRIKLRFSAFLSGFENDPLPEGPSSANARSSRPTVTVAMPAFNEKQGIMHLLEALVNQETASFALSSVIIYDDGSTDGTREVAEGYVSRAPFPVIFRDGGTRRGKMYRLNEMYRENLSDFLIVLDADIGLDGDDFLERFITAARADPAGVMFAAHQIMLRPKGIIPQLLYSAYALWDDVRLGIPNRDHVQCFYGAATLYRRAFAETLFIPKESTEERTYIYLMAKRHHGFRYVMNAKIYYWPPLTWGDYWRHTERSFGTDQPELRAIFGPEADIAHSVPIKYKLVGLFRSVVHRPFLTPISFLLNLAFRFVNRANPSRSSPLWEVATSTKIPIPSEVRTRTSERKGLPTIVFSNFDDRNNPYYAGGGAISIHEVAKRLAQHSRVIVVTGNYPGARDVRYEGVEYRRIGPSILGPRISQLAFHFLLPFAARRVPHDVWIESFTPPFSTSFLPLWTRKPVIGLVHMLSGRDMTRKYHIPFTLIENTGLRLYRHFIALTETSRDDILSKNPRANVAVIENGVYPPKNANNVRSSEGKHILSLGRIEIDQKGIDLLLEAYRKEAANDSTPLVLAGSGAPKDIARTNALICKHRLEGKVLMPGRVDGEEKEELYSHSVIGLMPSRFETFSLVLLEMMSYGIPVVCFDIPGFSWAPEDAVLRVPPFDVDRFSDAIRALWEDGELRAKIGSAARAYALQNDWDNVAERYAAFIRKIIAKE